MKLQITQNEKYPRQFDVAFKRIDFLACTLGECKQTTISLFQRYELLRNFQQMMI